MNIKIIAKKIDIESVRVLAQETYKEMIKGVVDVELGIIALGGDLHADAEQVLLDKGSIQKNLWGFNLYVDKPLGEALVYTSFINIRPRDNNNDMEVQDSELREKIKNIIKGLVCYA